MRGREYIPYLRHLTYCPDLAFVPGKYGTDMITYPLKVNKFIDS